MKETKELINDGKPVDYLLPQYNIPSFKRDPMTRRYDDDQLANAILNAIGVPAASFRVYFIYSAHVRGLTYQVIGSRRAWCHACH